MNIDTLKRISQSIVEAYHRFMNSELLQRINLSDKIQDKQLSLRWIMLFALIILIYSVTIRYAWIPIYSDNASYQWNDEILLTTNDAYHYATSAKLAVDGQIHNNSQLIITHCLVKMVPLLLVLGLQVNSPLSQWRLLPFTYPSYFLVLPASWFYSLDIY